MANGSKRGTQRAQRAYAASPEWYTPSWLLDRIRAFYGGAYFDPCPPSRGVVDVNGLAISWTGSVYVNPPYGRDIAPWIRKAMSEPLRECILLVPAYTETQWFAPLYQHTLCFITGRIYFERPNREEMQRTPHPSVLVYRGRRYRQFADAFADLGPVVRTYRPRRAAQPHLLLPLPADTTQPESEAV